MSILDQANNPRRLVPHHDDSDVSSYACPYATVLDGMRWWVQRDRLSFPLHGVEDQSQPWGPCVTPASGGEELHLYGTQVIKDLIGPCPSSLAHVPFRGNGSQLPHVNGSPVLQVLWADLTPSRSSALPPCGRVRLTWRTRNLEGLPSSRRLSPCLPRPEDPGRPSRSLP